MNFRKCTESRMRDPTGRVFLHGFQKFKDHEEISNRLKKTLYYGRFPKTQRPSLPLTEATVEFFAKAVPNSGLDSVDIHFAATISRNASISPCSMMLAMVYIEQLRHKNPEYLQKVSSCDLFLVSMMCASKYLYDDGEDDEVYILDWAESANMEIKELNRLEREFLAAIDWSLFAKPSSFFDVLQRVEMRIAQQESYKHSGTTYTDADVLSADPVLSLCWGILLEDVIKVVLVSTVAYVSAVATLLTATAVAPKCANLLSSSVGQFMSAPYMTAISPPTTTNCSTQHLYSQQEWHNLLQDKIMAFDPASETDQTSTNCTLRDSRDSEANSNFLDIGFPQLWIASRKEIQAGFHRPVFNDHKRFSLWNTFHYWPSCCGLNSYLL